MRRSALFAFGILTIAALLCPWSAAFAQSAPSEFVPREENPEDFPAAAGREEAFYACTACHGFKIVAQQGMNRRQWDDSLAWMERQGMPPLEGNDRKLVLDYLETVFPPRGRAGGAPNPFLKQ
jgi:hypothetical protein